MYLQFANRILSLYRLPKGFVWTLRILLAMPGILVNKTDKDRNMSLHCAAKVLSAKVPLHCNANKVDWMMADGQPLCRRLVTVAPISCVAEKQECAALLRAAWAQDVEVCGEAGVRSPAESGVGAGRGGVRRSRSAQPC